MSNFKEPIRPSPHTVSVVSTGFSQPRTAMLGLACTPKSNLTIIYPITVYQRRASKSARDYEVQIRWIPTFISQLRNFTVFRHTSRDSKFLLLLLVDDDKSLGSNSTKFQFTWRFMLCKRISISTKYCHGNVLKVLSFNSSYN